MTARVIRSAIEQSPRLSASVVTCGTFDGVHLGHRALVDRTVSAARAIGATSVVYTFDPHPAKLLAPSRAPLVLQSIEERVRHLSALGVELVIVEAFDAAFSEISADDWVRRYLVEPLSPRRVVVGANFSYGRARGGDPAHLARMGEQWGFDVEAVPLVEVGGEVVSSSRVRRVLAAGDVLRAAELLGRPFALTGVVVEGDRRGRTIGFPTANLAVDGELLPRSGVYASVAELQSGRRIQAVTNIGTRPTFAGDSPRVEAHLLDFDGDLYGARMRLELIARLRDERKFDGIEALVAQIHADIAAARGLFGGGSSP